MPFKPLEDKILVERVESSTEKGKDLSIPDHVEGKVVSVGKRVAEDGTLISPGLKSGDTAAGTEIQIDGVEHIILREDEVLGVIE
ncbi:10 kDa chaperonin [Penicillium vulpinum]|uniref:10 kDa chaperonin n=1 Tax=Penicillium vulpinum TaxID=29845 RepID=UPI002549A26F|nr:10 kDa chaperonin [Penicillium vulpinum]KAJ5972720.1 10 kDa chaperonin [Penicillium vulpinum]